MKVTVAELWEALSEFVPEAELYVQADAGCVALVAVMPDHLDVIRGRYADDSCTVVQLEKIS